MPPSSLLYELQQRAPLLARAELLAPDIKAAEKCARPVANEVGGPLFGNSGINLHQFMIYVSGPCMVLTILSSVFLTWKHLHRYTAPLEQRQIIRVVNLPIFYAVFNFIALCLYPYYLYIQPIGNVYEAFSVAAMFYLALEYVAPDGTDREKFFDNLPNKGRRGKIIEGGSLKWYWQTYSTVLQYPLSKTVLVIIEVITQYFGDFCENSWSPKHAHLYIQVLDYLFVGGALMSCIRFIRRFRKDEGVDPKHKMRPKAWTFVGIVLFQILQELVFHLMNGKLFHPSKTATYNDLNFGIPAFMTCVESIIFSLIFQWSFSSGEYKEGFRADRYGLGAAKRTSTLKAILSALNLSDIIVGTALAFKLIFQRTIGRISGLTRGTSGPQRQRTLKMEDQTHLEPLSNRQERVLRRAPDSDDSTTEYNPHSQIPTMPNAARDPSPAPPGRTRTLRADNLRPQMGRSDSYQRLTYTRSQSPSEGVEQVIRQMY